jgi:hypothetical protein
VQEVPRASQSVDGSDSQSRLQVRVSGGPWVDLRQLRRFDLNDDLKDAVMKLFANGASFVVIDTRDHNYKFQIREED